jgi:hypothetical protein
MTFLDRLYVAFATVFAGLVLFSLLGTEFAFAIPAAGILFVVTGGKKR